MLSLKTSTRAAVAAALLLGFPALVLLIVAAIVTLEVYTIQHSVVLAVKLAIIGVPVTIILFKGLFAVERSNPDTLAGLPVTPEAQPALWGLVRDLSVAVSTRPPDEILLVPDVNAAVQEETRLLGLRVVRRRLYIGAPLFLGLREDQLRAVLAHELAHYSNRDTRLAGLTYRGERSIRRTLSGLSQDKWSQRMIAHLFKLYARLYFSVSAKVLRRQELAADAAAARTAGTEAAAGALREVEVLSAAWNFFMFSYATVGWRAGYLPARLADGFRALLTDEQRAIEFEKIRLAPGGDEQSRYDSHPPTRDRIAAIDAMPPVTPISGGSLPAGAMLRNGLDTLEAALRTNLAAEAQAKKLLDWPELVNAGVHYTTAETGSELLAAASRVTGGVGTLDLALDVIDAGRLPELAGPDAVPGPDAGPRAQRELAAASVRKRLSSVVEVALADAGLGRWHLSWSGPATFVAPTLPELDTVLDEAVAAEADTTRLRALLTAAGIPSSYRPADSDPTPAHS